MSSGPGGEPHNNAPPDVGVGFGDTTLLVASVVGFCALTMTVYWLVLSRVKSREEMEQEDAEEDYEKRLANANVATLTRAQRRARAHFIMKQQRRAAVPTADADATRRENNNDEGAERRLVVAHVDNQDQQPPSSSLQPQLSRKERQRAAKAAEKQQRRLFEEDRQKQQKEAQELAQKERRERERLEAKREEETRRRMAIEKEERERQVQLEWETFLSGPDRTLSVEDWVGSLGRHVDIEELAESFSTSPEAVRSRIQTLVDEGRVTGVFEANRFICLYEDELKEIVQQIREAGSVSLSDVAGLCNQVIS